MDGVFGFLARAAELDIPVFLSGEEGTGKELAAQAIHSNSGRSSGPFIPVDCGAVRPGRIDKELFESTSASLAGTTLRRGDLWTKATGGTLFLNELDQLPSTIQITLGRLLDQGSRGTPDVRLIAGCALDMNIAAKTSQIRQELACHLSVFSCSVPPLRDRGGDIPLLAQHFLGRFATVHRPTVEGFNPEVIAALLAYDWPGNVRELRTVVERAVATAQGERITLGDLPFELRHGSESESGSDLATLTYREVLVRARDRASSEYLTALMRTHRGRVTQAAAAARIERESLHRLLKRYKVRAEAFREPGTSSEDS